MPRAHRKERRWLNQKSCRKGKGVQRRPAIHRFAFFGFFTPSNNRRSQSPLRFSFCVGVKVVAYFIYWMPVRVDEALHLGMALVIGFSQERQPARWCWMKYQGTRSVWGTVCFVARLSPSTGGTKQRWRKERD
ncbi:hypothetical protein LI328DRAFT_138316 [Trichoderma asperelloides]|nr:hypothetical protein LI328DRAFT_138316 [Trichoderma asperelloides]